MQFIAYCITLLFASFFILVGIFMFANTTLVKQTISKAGSTPFINYTELIIRMIPATALVLVSKESLYPQILNLFGWYMLGTSIVLILVPRKLHHDFATKAADHLSPTLLKIISPFTITFGSFLFYAVW